MEAMEAEDITPVRAAAEADCERFRDLLIDTVPEELSDDLPWMQIGRDFYFTRYDCGIGFWDNADIYSARFIEEATRLAQEFDQVETLRIALQGPSDEALLEADVSDVAYYDGYCYVILDEEMRQKIERLMGGGSDVNVLVGEDVIWRRGALSYRDGKWYLRWDPKNVKCYSLEG